MNISGPPPNGNSDVLLWILVPVLGVCIALIAFFLKQVFNQIKASSEGRANIYRAVESLGDKFETRLDPIREGIQQINGRVGKIEVWQTQHEKYDDANHQDHGRRLDEHGQRINRMEYGERRQSPRNPAQGK